MCVRSQVPALTSLFPSFRYNSTISIRHKEEKYKYIRTSVSVSIYNLFFLMLSLYLSGYEGTDEFANVYERISSIECEMYLILDPPLIRHSIVCVCLCIYIAVSHTHYSFKIGRFPFELIIYRYTRSQIHVKNAIFDVPSETTS